MDFILLITGFAFLFLGVVESDSVEITKFEVPHHVKKHDDVDLICESNLPPEHLFMVQWYHNEQEFYRYTEGDANKILLFNESGLNVNIEDSSSTRVSLKSVNTSASGLYKCMVMADKSEGGFKRTSKKANMTVVVIPISKPLIEPPLGDSLRPGSVVSLNCTSSPSIPAANLVWEVNEKPVPDSYLQEFPLEKTEEGLFISKVGLYFKVEKKHFKNSTLNLRCVSRISTFYHQSDEHKHKLPRNQNSNQEEPPAQPAIGSNLMKSNGAYSIFPQRALGGLALALLLALVNLR
ncbi:UNVERIFIED_CONTAM: hypothetical protein RMT77_006231 [Armadillidium vulgare]